MGKPTIQPTKDINEFVKQWDKRIEKIIRSHGMGEHMEDIKQEIYMRIIQDDGLEKYDPTRGSFSTYCYALILTKVRNARTKFYRERRIVPVSLEQKDVPENTEYANGRQRDRLELHAMSLIGQSENPVRNIEVQRHIESTLDILRRQTEVRSHFFRDGKCITRDLATLLTLILEGKTREEIVEHLDYSTGSVGILFKELRERPELKELFDLVSE